MSLKDDQEVSFKKNNFFEDSECSFTKVDANDF